MSLGSCRAGQKPRPHAHARNHVWGVSRLNRRSPQKPLRLDARGPRSSDTRHWTTTRWRHFTRSLAQVASLTTAGLKWDVTDWATEIGASRADQGVGGGGGGGRGRVPRRLALQDAALAMTSAIARPRPLRCHNPIPAHRTGGRRRGRPSEHEQPRRRVGGRAAATRSRPAGAARRCHRVGTARVDVRRGRGRGRCRCCEREGLLIGSLR